MNDAELVDSTLAGDPSAPEQLVRRHAPRLRALCWSRLPANGPVDDMVQETFLRGFRLLPTLERRESVASFLSGIAVRVCSDWRRARARSEVPLDADMHGGDESSHGAGRANDPAGATERLQRAVHALPEIYRDVVALCYFADRSYREIAAALGITESAVNARLTQARRLLRDALSEGER